MRRAPGRLAPTAVVLLGLLCLPLTSCVAVVAASAAGVGFMKYQKNENSRVFQQDVEVTWLATLQVMTQLGYGESVSKTLDPMEARAEFKDASDTIFLSVESLAEGGTRLSVRVGKFDSKKHRRKALVILEGTSELLQGDDELHAWSQKVQELESIRDGDELVRPDGTDGTDGSQ
jgi:hypothetical protein